MRDRPTVGEVEERSAPEAATLTVEGNTLHGLIPYNVESRDLGGWREVMEPGCLTAASRDDLVATLNHDVSRLLGRHPTTLTVEDRDDGLAWACELPDSPTGQDVRESVRRGDLRSTSWRMVVGKDRWAGEVRHVEEVRSLRDVAVVTTSAYPADSAPAELRSRPAPEDNPADERTDEEQEQDMKNRTGGLTVEDRAAPPDGGTIEERVWESMQAVQKGEARSLTRATTDPVQPDDLQKWVWDKLRDSAVVLASGVRVLDTDRGEIKVPYLAGDMTADFYDELEEIAESDLDLDELTLTPKAIKALAHGSSEAFEDSDPSLLQIVTDNLHTVLGLKLDRELLIGNAAKGFKGLANMTGIQTLAVGGAMPNYDPIIKAVGMLADAGVPGPYAVVLHPRVATSLDLLKEATGSNATLVRPDGLPPFYLTRQLGLTGSGESATSLGLVYAPGQLLVGRRRDVTVEVDRSEEFSTDAVKVRGKLRATIGTPHPQAIVKLTGIASPPIETMGVEDEE